MTADLSSALRAIKPERKTVRFVERTSGPFAAVSAIGDGRRPMLLDTNVYIRNARGTLPPAVTGLLDRSLQFHSTVCLGEIGVGISAYHPSAMGYTATRDHYERLIRSIPDTRILAPDSQIWLEAGLVTGTLARTQRLQPSQRKEFLNDALIYLTAVKYGIPVLTENRQDFDLIEQIVGRGTFIYF